MTPAAITLTLLQRTLARLHEPNVVRAIGPVRADGLWMLGYDVAKTAMRKTGAK